MGCIFSLALKVGFLKSISLKKTSGQRLFIEELANEIDIDNLLHCNTKTQHQQGFCTHMFDMCGVLNWCVRKLAIQSQAEMVNI